MGGRCPRRSALASMALRFRPGRLGSTQALRALPALVRRHDEKQDGAMVHSELLRQDLESPGAENVPSPEATGGAPETRRAAGIQSTIGPDWHSASVGGVGPSATCTCGESAANLRRNEQGARVKIAARKPR